MSTAILSGRLAGFFISIEEREAYSKIVLGLGNEEAGTNPR
jgi:hypothetical protein